MLTLARVAVFKNTSLLYFECTAVRPCGMPVLEIMSAHCGHRMLSQHQCPSFMRKLKIKQRLSNSPTERMSPQPICGDSVVCLPI